MERNEFKLYFKQQLEAITREANGTVEQILRTDEYFIDKTKIGRGSFPVNQNQTRTVLLYVLKKIIREINIFLISKTLFILIIFKKINGTK